MKLYWKRAMMIKLIMTAIFCLIGCADVLRTEEPAPVARIPVEMISLSVSYNDMVRISAYNYELKERNGEVLFSCRYFNDNYEEIAFDDISVDSEYINKMRELVEKYGFVNMEYKKPGPMDHMVSDAPMYSMTMYFPKVVGERISSESHRLNYHPQPGTDEVLKLFYELRDLAVRSIEEEKHENQNQ